VGPTYSFLKTLYTVPVGCVCGNHSGSQYFHACNSFSVIFIKIMSQPCPYTVHLLYQKARLVLTPAAVVQHVTKPILGCMDFSPLVGMLVGVGLCIGVLDFGGG